MPAHNRACTATTLSPPNPNLHNLRTVFQNAGPNSFFRRKNSRGNGHGSGEGAENAEQSNAHDGGEGSETRDPWRLRRCARVGELEVSADNLDNADNSDDLGALDNVLDEGPW